MPEQLNIFLRRGIQQPPPNFIFLESIFLGLHLLINIALLFLDSLEHNQLKIQNQDHHS
jgi:hypothetical protein